MIHTVFVTAAGTRAQWQAELLAYSWAQVRQPGELVRLHASRAGQAMPQHRLMYVVGTLDWCPHPYTGDVYPPYNQAASLLEWLFTERVQGTVLLLETDSVFCAPLGVELAPGQAQASAWAALPRGDGPFGLGPDFAFLDGFCVDRTLELQAVGLPLLISADALRKVAARWLELMGIIRAETARQPAGPRVDADRIAYAIAAAEAGIQHTVADLHSTTQAAAPSGPILHYRQPIAGADGTWVWDAGSYHPGDPVDPAHAVAGPARTFLTLLNEHQAMCAQDLEFAFVRPRRSQGVREGRVLGSLFLEIPGRADTVSLNVSGAAIWEACDGHRSLPEINQALEARFDMPAGSLRADVDVVIKRLEYIGALVLETV